MILVIGEALIDLIGRGGSEYEAVVGGANANVALALAVRGEEQSFLGRISNDGFGQLIRNHLASHGVNLDHAVQANEQTSLAVATINSEGVASYSFYINGTADWGWNRDELPSIEDLERLGVKAIQFGCLGMAIEPGASVIFEWLKEVEEKTSITLSHDLNMRPAIGLERLRELERVEKINRISDVIKASDADVEWLYGESDQSKLENIYMTWSEDKPVIVTRGESGVSIYLAGQRIDVPGFKADLKDTVGAGDTFIAHFLGELNQLGLLGNKSDSLVSSPETLAAAARFANAASSIVCERVGCNPPTKEEVLERLRD